VAEFHAAQAASSLAIRLGLRCASGLSAPPPQAASALLTKATSNMF
jgi:hypothetical protein